MKKILIIMIFSVLINCTEDNEFIPNEINVKLLKKITYPDSFNDVINTHYTMYEYDEKNRITSSKSFDGNDNIKIKILHEYILDTTKVFTYNGSELKNYTITYRIDNGLIEKEDFYGKSRLDPNFDFNTIRYLGFKKTTFNSCNIPEKLESYSINNILTGYTTFSYTDINGSVTTKRYKADDTLWLETKTLKNEKISAYNQISNFDCFIRTSIQVESWDYRDCCADSNYSWEYNYDNDNYPISEIQLNNNSGSTRKKIFEYY